MTPTRVVDKFADGEVIHTIPTLVVEIIDSGLAVYKTPTLVVEILEILTLPPAKSEIHIYHPHLELTNLIVYFVG